MLPANNPVASGNVPGSSSDRRVELLFTTPGALSTSSPVTGFLLKDILLLGAALSTAAEALRAAPRATR